MQEEKKGITRRELLHKSVRGAVLLGISGGLGFLATNVEEDLVWQLDPEKCIACGKCATNCVLTPSAVKATRAHAICGYCDLCLAYFEPQPNALNTGAENQRCPTGALIRAYVEDPYYTYTVDEDLCIGCARCVKGCAAFGNGSTFLQVRHDRCLNCHQCSIAAVCPSGAFRRVPASQPYLLRGCFNARSVGQGASENTEGKEAEAGNSTERVGDAGRRSPPVFAAAQSQDGVLKQPLNGKDTKG